MLNNQTVRSVRIGITRKFCEFGFKKKAKLSEGCMLCVPENNSAVPFHRLPVVPYWGCGRIPGETTVRVGACQLHGLLAQCCPRVPSLSPFQAKYQRYVSSIQNNICVLGKGHMHSTQSQKCPQCYPFKCWLICYIWVISTSKQGQQKKPGEFVTWPSLQNNML